VVSGVEITRGSLRKKINTINIKKKLMLLITVHGYPLMKRLVLSKYLCDAKWVESDHL
jgi:hypothetical protein